ncbi:hypothetical protein Thpro_022602 [Acidihalobacter prosperus]|uniref:Uncharacterized protein n=1 Tax=Acidihalobacter prosperus TaxID=160660 RepID=A0A1A6C1A9_9GAMM|nr:hypothetical protein Thpro_022602 [Acidihalobacter prosperus]
MLRPASLRFLPSYSDRTPRTAAGRNTPVRGPTRRTLLSRILSSGRA